MTTITDWDGIEHTIHYRRVPGYFNRSTYHVDIDHQHVMTVSRISDSTWSRSAVWSAYLPGVDWSAAAGKRDSTAFYLTGDRSRELAVKAALRKIKRVAQASSVGPPEWHDRTQATLTDDEMASLAAAINTDPTGPVRPSRGDALRMPHSEVTANGRCVGRLTFEPGVGTVLVIEYCECADGKHITAGREQEAR